MLVLSREAGESIMLGDDIEIVVVRTGTEKVRIGIQAPKEVAINRREVYDAIQRNGGVDLKPRGGKQHPAITPINPEKNDAPSSPTSHDG